MARKPRIEYYGAIYHVIQKGNGIFKSDNDKSYLLELLSEARDIYDFKVFAYVIMDNGYQFLIQTLNIPISTIMHIINFRYAKYYNNKSNRTGPVFEDRYTSILVGDERYILPLVKYIHNKPVYAKICNTTEEYKWSSDTFFRVNMEGMIDIKDILNMFSINRIESIEKYVEYMEKDLDYKTIEHLCEDDFIMREEPCDSQDKNNTMNHATLDEFLKKSCPTEEEYKLIKEGCRKRYLTQYKVKYIQTGREKGYTYNDLGQNIGITGTAARTLVHMWKKETV